MLMHYFGLFQERVDVTGQVKVTWLDQLEEELEEGRQRAASRPH